MKQIALLTGICLTLISTGMAQNNTCETDAYGIFSGPHGDLFRAEYDAYTASEATLTQGHFKDVSIKVILGNWCSDSQREVPHLLRMLETAPMKGVPVTFYLVNEDKFCPDPEVQALKANYVPTIIFYRDGKELGRIVETPEGTLESHTVKIVQ